MSSIDDRRSERVKYNKCDHPCQIRYMERSTIVGGLHKMFWQAIVFHPWNSRLVSSQI